MYKYNGRIRYSECDASMHLDMIGLVNYFQDTSTFHTESSEVNMTYLQDHKMAWVLTYWNIIVERYPKLGEEVSVLTWPYEFAGFTGKRNFVMKDGQENVIAYANTLWVLVDTEKNRMKKIDAKQIDFYSLSQAFPMAPINRKVAIHEDSISQESFKVNAMDIDSNGHVNNSKYIQMAMAYLPTNAVIKELRVEYKAEAKLGDMIYPSLAIDNNIYSVVLGSEGKAPYSVVEFQLK